MPPSRLCLVCRQTAPQASLLRLCLTQGRVHLGKGAEGRSAYVCMTQTCLQGLNSGMLSRAFRKPVTLWDTEDFLSNAKTLALRRILENIGLARRSGALQIGSDRVFNNHTHAPGDVLLAAHDLSERGLGQAQRNGAQLLCDGATLGRACGLQRAGVVRISAGALAQRTAHWLQLWKTITELSDDHHVSDNERQKKQPIQRSLESPTVARKVERRNLEVANG
ncbi:MAG: YlxR family protein [Myxococcota bacterium]